MSPCPGLLACIVVLAACGSDPPPKPTAAAAPDAATRTVQAPKAADAAPTTIPDAVTIDAGPPAAVTPDGVVRVVLIHGELSKSELKEVARLRKALGKARPRGQVVDAVEAEIAVAQAWLAGTPAIAPPLPTAWASAPVVVVMVTGGIAGTLAFHPPIPEPVFSERGLGAGFLGAEALAGLIAVAARAEVAP